MLSNKRKIILFLIASLCFGIVAAVSDTFGKQQMPVSFVKFVIASIGFFTAAVCLERFSSRHFSAAKPLSRRQLLCVFVAYLLVGVLFLLIYYPGTGNYDTIYIYSASKFAKVSGQHPICYVALARLTVLIAKLFGKGYETAFLLFTIAQVVLGAMCYTYALYWLQQHGASKGILITVFLYYLLSPVLNVYRISIQKDVPYSYVVMLLFMYIYDLAGSKKAGLRTTLYGMLLMVCSFLRSNGLFTMLFLLAILFLLLKQNRRTIIAMLLTLVLVNSVVTFAEKRIGVERLFKESVGIPLQQIAYTIVHDGKITPENLAFIDRVVPIDYIKEHFDPWTADRLKWGGSPIDDDFLYHHKKEFIRTYLQTVFANPILCIKEELYATNGFWSLYKPDTNLIFDSLYVKTYAKWLERNGVRMKEVLPDSLQQYAEKAMNIAIEYTPWCGVSFWISLFFMTVLVSQGKRKALTASLIILCGWVIIMISTPVAYQYRYTLYVQMINPILFALIFIKKPSAVNAD